MNQIITCVCSYFILGVALIKKGINHIWKKGSLYLSEGSLIQLWMGKAYLSLRQKFVIQLIGWWNWLFIWSAIRAPTTVSSDSMNPFFKKFVSLKSKGLYSWFPPAGIYLTTTCPDPYLMFWVKCHRLRFCKPSCWSKFNLATHNFRCYNIKPITNVLFFSHLM